MKWSTVHTLLVAIYLAPHMSDFAAISLGTVFAVLALAAMWRGK